MSYQYATLAPEYARYAHYSPHSSSSSSPDHTYAYYVPPVYHTAPLKHTRQQRRGSHSVPTRTPVYHVSTDYPSSNYHPHSSEYPPSASKRKDHVSGTYYTVQPQSRRYSTSAKSHGSGHRGSSTTYTVNIPTITADHSSSRPRRQASVQIPISTNQSIDVDTSDSADESPSFHYIKPRKTENRSKTQYYRFQTEPSSDAKANSRYFPEQSSPRKSQEPPMSHSRSKSSSHHRSNPTRHESSKKASKEEVHGPRAATASDAAKHRINAAFSLKNWDPEEAPITLLGSVFDANSLGKWIYDWTVYHHGPATPMSEVAGDLWLLLIKLAHKIKRAEESLPRIDDYDDEELVEDFLESGDRLWARFKKLLKQCEDFMYKAARKDGKSTSSNSGAVKMGKNSGCEFVDSIFGRDRFLEETESMMQGIRLWNMRFDSNCESIIYNA